MSGRTGTRRPYRRIAALALLIAPVCVAISAPPAAAQQVELRWRLDPGAEHLYRQVQTTRTSAPMGEMTQTQTTVLRHAVRSVSEDGSAELRITYASARLVQEGPMGRQEFDSESGTVPSDPGMAMLARMVGRSFDITVAPDGSILDVSGMEELIESILEGLEDEEPAVAAQVRSTVEGMFGEDGLRAAMQQGMQTLPRGPVGPGTEWSLSIALPLPFGTSRSEYRYTLRELVEEEGRTVALIDVKGTVGELEPDPTSPMAGMIELSGGEVAGELAFDADRGLLVRSTVRTRMNVAVMGQAMPMDSTLDVELLPTSP